MSDAPKPTDQAEPTATRMDRWMVNAWISQIRHPHASPLIEEEPEPIPRRLRLVSLYFKGVGILILVGLAFVAITGAILSVDGSGPKLTSIPFMAIAVGMAWALHFTGEQLEKRSRLAGVSAAGAFLYWLGSELFSQSGASYFELTVATLGLVFLATVWKELR